MRGNTICSAFSLDCHYNKSTIDLIRDVYCPRKSVWVNFAYTKRPFNLSAEAFINVRKVRLCGRFTVFFLKIKQFSFSYSLAKGFTFWNESTFNSRCYLRSILSWQLLFQQRERRISWRLWKNSETHLWWGIVWSLIIFSQSSF